MTIKQRIVDAYEPGMTHAELARRAGASRNTVAVYRKRLMLDIRTDAQQRRDFVMRYYRPGMGIRSLIALTGESERYLIGLGLDVRT